MGVGRAAMASWFLPTLAPSYLAFSLRSAAIAWPTSVPLASMKSSNSDGVRVSTIAFRLGLTAFRSYTAFSIPSAFLAA